MNTDDKRFDKTATQAVARVLLYRKSPMGGSYGGDIDKRRAVELLPTLDGAALYELLVDVAREASKEAQAESDRLSRGILAEATRLAEHIDSLTLWRFIQSKKED